MKTFLTLLMTLWLAQPAWAAGPERALEKAVRAALGEGARVEVRSVRLSAPWPAASEARLVNQERPYGLVAFEGRGVAGTAEVRAHLPVVVVSSAMNDGEPFTSDNTRLEERELTRIAGAGYHSALPTLARFRARGSLRAGTVVSAAHTQAPVLVQAGQSVELVLERGGLKVRARVEALQRGRDQEWIRVRNPSTRKVLQARVVGLGTVTL